MEDTTRIAILGAPGCVGKTVIRKLLQSSTCTITASYRIEEEIPEDIRDGRLSWKKVDLFDASSAEDFLRDADVLIYLIHSLGAKNFEELDIKLANATGSAARSVGVRKIIYLGGIVPDEKNASSHLISRMKTGRELASFDIPVAEIRASILLAGCSMSYLIVYNLAKRLPLMITPRWLNSLCAPIALDDAAEFVEALITYHVDGHEIFEIGSDTMRYRDLLSLCGKSIRGVENVIISVPFFAINLSSLWIQFVTGVPNSVGIALAEGLRSDTVPSNNRFHEVAGRPPAPVEAVLNKLAVEMKSKG